MITHIILGLSALCGVSYCFTCPSDGFFVNPENCNEYYRCVGKRVWKSKCTPGLHFNQYKAFCDYPQNVDCTPTAPPPTTEPPPTNPPDPTEPRPPTEPKPTEPEPSGGYKRVCYWINWGWYRQNEGKYLPEDLDPSLCTHIMYAFAVLDVKKHILRPHDGWADISNKFYERMIAHKKSPTKPKVLIALGGWNDSGHKKYSELVNSPSLRKNFIKEVIAFIDKYGFDGLDLDWEYPVCWQTRCTQGPKSDKDAFSAWVKELRAAFDTHSPRLLLTAAVSPNTEIIDLAYDVPVINKNLDFINVMTYDYFGAWNKYTGHHAPLYHHPGHPIKEFNANVTIHHYIKRGADPKNLIMGLPIYGRSFTLADAKKTEVGARAYGGGENGFYTNARGFLGFYEICQLIKNRGYRVIRDKQERIGPIAVKGNQWVGYDDLKTIDIKIKYLKQMGLGGAMVWDTSMDDFKNKCGFGNNPFQTAIKKALEKH